MGAIYFDESLDRKTALLSAIVVPNSIIQPAIENLRKLKETLFEPKDRDVEFHTVHMFYQNNKFTNYQMETIKAIFETCARSLQKLNIKTFCVYYFLRKPKIQSELKIAPNFWKTLLINLNKYLLNNSITEKYFLMIDQQNKKEDKINYDKINNLIIENKLTCLILEPIFYDSKLLSLIQFADFSAWISRRCVTQAVHKYTVIEKSIIKGIFTKIEPTMEKITCMRN